MGPVILTALLILSGTSAALSSITLGFSIFWLRRAHRANTLLLVQIEEYARQVRNAVHPAASIYDAALAAGDDEKTPTT